MAQHLERNPLEAAFAALRVNGLDGGGEALQILVNEANRIEREHFLNARPHERSRERTDYANGFKPKTVITRLGQQTFDIPQVRGGENGVDGIALRSSEIVAVHAVAVLDINVDTDDVRSKISGWR